MNSKGCKAAYTRGLGYAWSVEDARRAGRKGGLATSRDTEHMKRIGSMGGKARHAKKAMTSEEPESSP